jgi:hypothetical protein
VPRKKRLRIYSSKKTRNGYTVHEVDIATLGDHEVAGVHLRFNCPWCTEVRTDKKLYYNAVTGIGFCFRCEAVLVDKASLKKTRHKIHDFDQFSWFNFSKVGDYLDISWAKTALISPEAKSYVLSREGNYDLDIISHYNLRYFEGSGDKTLLLLPNLFPETDRVDAFQTTVAWGYRNPLAPKYMTYPEDKSIFYLQQNIYRERVYFVEGIFDAIASHGCPILGKSFSKNQLKQLYMFFKAARNLKEIFLVLDGEVKKPTKVKTCRQILGINSSVKVYYTDLPGELDPEQCVNLGVFDECVEKKSYKVIP